MLGVRTDSRSEIRTSALPAFTPVLVLAMLPWVLLAISTDWIYSDAGLIDPWLYHGYFHRFPEFVSDFFPGTYYGTRLAWIVPGYVVYHLLPPHVANVTLHIGFFYVSLFAVYRVAAIFSGRSAALLSASAYGTSGPVLVAFGWDYVDGAIITYSAVAIWAIVEAAARPRHRITLLVVAGSAAAGVVHCNLGALLLTPVFLIAYWYTHDDRRWRDAGAAIAGVVLTTGLLGIVSVTAGGPFLFFLPSLRWAVASIGTQPFTPAPPLKWPGSARFILPLAGVVAAAGAFSRRRAPATRVSLFMLLLLTAVFAAHDWIFSGGLLQTQYYVSWFLPLAFLGIAVGIGTITPPPGVTIVLCLAIIGLEATALIVSLGHPRRALALLGSNLPLLEVLTVGAALLVIAAVSASMRRSWQLIVLVGALALANFIVVPNLGVAPSNRGPSQFIAVQQTLSFIGEHVPHTSRSPLFWMGGKSPNGQYYASLASTHLYLYSLIGDRYPQLPDDTGKEGRFGAVVKPTDYVVVVADSAANEATVRREFQRFNMDAVVEAATEVTTPRARFVLTLLHITGRK